MQKEVWRSLSSLSSLNLPWFVAGDFNAILSSNEHRGGSFHYYAAKFNGFKDFLSRNQLLDLGFLGPSFTWCNGQQGMARR